MFYSIEISNILWSFLPTVVVLARHVRLGLLFHVLLLILAKSQNFLSELYTLIKLELSRLLQLSCFRECAETNIIFELRCKFYMWT